MTDRTGQQLGNYLLTRPLGQGGFAEVYQGEHIYLKTQAAIKVLLTQLASDDIEEFLKEARTIANLIHPNIVRVLEFGIESKTPFLVMDYAPNGTLRQRHPKGSRLEPAVIVPYLKQIAAGLQYAHDQKLIHRDIKPENLLVGRHNEILLSDFGIALVAQSSRYQSTQNVAGTVAYMSPEQIQGKPRPASDQYSLGIVVYEWLSGSRPFHGSFTELCTQHMFATPPPLSERVPTIFSEVEQVVNTALAKDPRQRFESVQAFAKALAEASHRRVSGSTISGSPIQQSSSQIPPTTPARPVSRPAAIPLTTMDRQSPSPLTQVNGKTSSERRAAPLPAPSHKFYPTVGTDSQSSRISLVKAFIRAMGKGLIIPLSGLLGLLLGGVAFLGAFLLINHLTGGGSLVNQGGGEVILNLIAALLLVGGGLVLGIFLGVKGARRL
ncbi:MAG TPA: serine/threonine-protein kinase [Ktedonobacteraceae bacterium]|nr:serine/threonine-protein kinase [Ktedonobacteraceae bacterium]